MLLLILALAWIGSSVFLVRQFYLQQTQIAPAKGGEIVEGMVGFPRSPNQIVADDSDVDRDLLQLLYAGLLSYDEESILAPDLLESYQVQGENKLIELVLKDNLRWSDGKPITADDVIFTIEAIQDPQNKSPLRRNWLGVTVKKISDLRIQLELKESYIPFLERLTLKPIPKHIWEGSTPESFYRPSNANLKPVGSGPYVVTKITQEKENGAIRELQLEPNPYYHSNAPFIPVVKAKFYASQDELTKAAEQGQITSFAMDPFEKNAQANSSRFASHIYSLPRYFAIFFNLDAPAGQDVIKNKTIRKALALALDRNKIAADIFGSNGKIVVSPLLSDLFQLTQPENNPEPDFEKALELLGNSGYGKKDGKIVQLNSPKLFQGDLKEGSKGTAVEMLQECLAKDKEIYPDGTVSGSFGALTKEAVMRFQQKYANDILKPSGLSKGNGVVGPATRAKLNEICFGNNAYPVLQILLTIPDNPTFQAVAQNIKNQWETFGITVEIQSYSLKDITTTVIPKRAYQTLLFGEILNILPDPLPFWHSSQKDYPGFNLSAYQNKEADALLEQARKESDPSKRKEKFVKLQTMLLEDLPAITLYDTNYIYATPKELQGIKESIIAEPSQRFTGIANWYMRTARQWK